MIAPGILHMGMLGSVWLAIHWDCLFRTEAKHSKHLGARMSERLSRSLEEDLEEAAGFIDAWRETTKGFLRITASTIILLMKNCSKVRPWACAGADTLKASSLSRGRIHTVE